jgi:hypothetical protein
MPKFRKRPVVIDAVKWTGSNVDDVRALGLESPDVRGTDLLVPTLEGPLRAAAGDWLIRGVQGEFYPCKPDIFAATYEPAGESSVDPTRRPARPAKERGSRA